MTDQEILKAEFNDLNSIITIHIFRDMNPGLWEAFKAKLPFTFDRITQVGVFAVRSTAFSPFYRA